MQPFNPADLLWRALAIFLVIGAVTGIVLALVLILKPQLIERIDRVTNHWVSMRHISLWMDRSISIERWCYRHHRPLGLFVILAASYMLMYFGWQFDRAVALKSLSIYGSNKLLLEMLLQAIDRKSVV